MIKVKYLKKDERNVDFSKLKAGDVVRSKDDDNAWLVFKNTDKKLHYLNLNTKTVDGTVEVDIKNGSPVAVRLSEATIEVK